MGTLAAYVTVISALAAGAVGVPVPEELVLLSAGAAAHRGAAEIWTMLLVAVVGVFVTDMFLFGLGRFFGPAVLTRAPAKWLLPPERALRVEKMIHKHGGKLALLARFLPGMRAPTFLMLGAHRQNAMRFVIGDGIAIAVSVPALVMVGYLASDSIAHVAESFGRVKHWLVIFAALAIAGYVVLRFMRARTLHVPADLLPATAPEEASAAEEKNEDHDDEDGLRGHPRT